LSLSGSFNQVNVTNSESLIPGPYASEYLSEEETATDCKSISESDVTKFSLLPRNLLDEENAMNDKPCASERLSRKETATNSKPLMLNRLTSNSSSNQETPMRNFVIKQYTSRKISLLTNQFSSTKQRAGFTSDFSIETLLSKKTTSTVREDFIMDVDRCTSSENSSNSGITKHKTQKNDACTYDNSLFLVRKNFYFTLFFYITFFYIYTRLLFYVYANNDDSLIQNSKFEKIRSRREEVNK